MFVTHLLLLGKSLTDSCYIYSAKVLKTFASVTITIFVFCEMASVEEQQIVKAKTGYKCQWKNCGLTFDTFNMLIEHVKDEVKSTGSMVDVEKPWICYWNDCERVDGFQTKYELVNHLRIHTKEEPFLCTVSCY